jgi:hypothetical protein
MVVWIMDVHSEGLPSGPNFHPRPRVVAYRVEGVAEFYPTFFEARKHGVKVFPGQREG